MEPGFICGEPGPFPLSYHQKRRTLTSPLSLRLHGQPHCSSWVISRGAFSTKYSTTSCSHSQSPPPTVSLKWLSRLSSSLITAAEPPSAATVWERIGYTLETRAISSSGLASAAAMAVRRHSAAGTDDCDICGYCLHSYPPVCNCKFIYDETTILHP